MSNHEDDGDGMIRISPSELFSGREDEVCDSCRLAAALAVEIVSTKHLIDGMFSQPAYCDPECRYSASCLADLLRSAIMSLEGMDTRALVAVAHLNKCPTARSYAIQAIRFIKDIYDLAHKDIHALDSLTSGMSKRWPEAIKRQYADDVLTDRGDFTIKNLFESVQQPNQHGTSYDRQMKALSEELPHEASASFVLNDSARSIVHMMEQLFSTFRESLVKSGQLVQS